MKRLLSVLVVALLWTSSAPAQSSTQTPAPRPAVFQIPDSVEVRDVDIYSEGTRMSGQRFASKANQGKKLPTIIMAQGWGGVAASLRRDAAGFAEKGYLVLTFDYRGWGTSDSRVILTQKREPAEHPNGRFTAEVQEVREVVAPLDMVIDWQNAVAFVVSDPQCDVDRLGLWGSSLSGGLVVSVAARDSRVKAIHSQVPALHGHWSMDTPAERKTTLTETTRRAHGELGYPEPRAKSVGNLIGAPIRFQFAAWNPIDEIDSLTNCAIQFVTAEKEELLDNKTNGNLAFERKKGAKNFFEVPAITHYGIYREAATRAHEMAQAWFDRYLK